MESYKITRYGDPSILCYNFTFNNGLKLNASFLGGEASQLSKINSSEVLDTRFKNPLEKFTFLSNRKNAGTFLEIYDQNRNDITYAVIQFIAEMTSETIDTWIQKLAQPTRDDVHTIVNFCKTFTQIQLNQISQIKKSMVQVA